MDQDIAVRLANEGVPLRAIARVVRVPCADVREQLQLARAQGELIDIPCEDWPPGYPRDQRLRELARRAVTDKADLETVARRIFGLRPAEVTILLNLVRWPAVPRAEFMRLLNVNALAISVYLYRLRQRLNPFGLCIETQHGYGYCMPRADRRRAIELLMREC